MTDKHADLRSGERLYDVDREMITLGEYGRRVRAEAEHMARISGRQVMSDTPTRQPSAGGMTATEAQQAGATEKQLVQAIAIAIFEELEQKGLDPWERTPISDPTFGRGFRIGHAWELYEKQARAHLAAINTVMGFLSGKVVGL